VSVFFPYVPYRVLHYRTVKMDPPYENKDLVITLSTSARTNVSDLIDYVIYWNEDKCNWTLGGFGGSIDISIPRNNGSSHIVTFPAKEIWYIAFYSFRKQELISVYFNVVDRPYSPSPAFIPSLNLSVIVLLILSLFVYRQ